MNNYLGTQTSISSDTIILVVLFAAIAFLGLRTGRSYLISLVLSLYISSFLYKNLFFIKKLVFASPNSNGLFWNQLGILALLTVATNLIINPLVGGHYDHGKGKLLKIALLAVGITGLVLSILYHIVPINSVYDFSSGIDKLFASDTFFSLWLLIPLVILFF